MMNKRNVVNRKWKYLLLTSAQIVVFSLVSFSQSKTMQRVSPVELIGATDSIKIEYILVPESAFDKIAINDGVMIYINKNSQLLIDNEPRSFNDLQQTVCDNYIKKTSSKLDLTSDGVLKAGALETRIYLRKDVKTNETDYEKLVENLSLCISSIQDFYSEKFFSKTFSALTDNEQTQISNVIKPKLYSMAPKDMGELK